MMDCLKQQKENSSLFIHVTAMTFYLKETIAIRVEDPLETQRAIHLISWKTGRNSQENGHARVEGPGLFLKYSPILCYS